ncbi:MAG: aminoglycoside phosphotransferase family protein [Desulfosalsimonadaceae bacterium]
MLEYTDKQIINAARSWNLDASSIRKDIEISGSPQRCEFRCVVECADSRLYVLEAVNCRTVPQKQAIIDRLDFMAGQGLSGINPYIRAADGRHILENNGCFWQVSPFVPGVPLDRPGYAGDRWRGDAMADFLISLRQTSRNIPAPLLTPPFSILDYIDTLTGRIQAREPGLFETIDPIIRYVEKHLALIHDRLPTAFCHGDFHPLNMIWSENHIKAVIDWEFCGTKPEIYDAATLIGCMGMETPDALTGPLVTAFIRHLKASGILSNLSWSALPAFMVAIRFGWLSEWLRNRDTEMIELETVYMGLLVTHAEDLKNAWGIR